MYKVAVNDDALFNIEEREAKVFVNDKEVALDLSKISHLQTHILYQNRSYSVEIVEVNQEDKCCRIKINGNIYTANVEDQYDQLLKHLGMDNLTSGKVVEVKAPMPGLVLKVLVEENTEVKKGDNLLILEAMKMENILKSATDGTVKKISIKQGDKVEKNQILIQFN